MHNYLLLLLLLSFCSSFPVSAQVDQSGSEIMVLRPDLVFDGENIQAGWIVVTEGDRIRMAGPQGEFVVPLNATVIDLPGATLLPGLIEGHSHLLLHPYIETSWNDQVLLESEAERVARAVVHAEATLRSGFTTVRDLGSEGAGYADVGIKTAIEKGVIPGPRMLVAGPAIVATGSYGPSGFAPHVKVPLGAQEADGQDALIKTVREQIGGGADLIKVYADYRWGPNNEARPTFSQEELNLIVATANSSGREVVAHAATAEGMRRATMAGVKTIEHGDGGTPAVFALMAQKGVALCPTLAAGDAISQYRGWKKGSEPEPDRIKNKRASFKMALDAGVTICAGGDVGVFTHGDNVRELEMMTDYGMLPLNVLRSATSVNADFFGQKGKIGRIKPGMAADLLAVEGRPHTNISDLRKIQLVIKNGKVIRKEF